MTVVVTVVVVDPSLFRTVDVVLVACSFLALEESPAIVFPDFTAGPSAAAAAFTASSETTDVVVSYVDVEAGTSSVVGPGLAIGAPGEGAVAEG